MYEVIESKLFKLHASPKLLLSAHHAPSMSLLAIPWSPTALAGTCGTSRMSRRWRQIGKNTRLSEKKG